MFSASSIAESETPRRASALTHSAAAVDAGRGQLTGRGGIAQIVRAFAKEADAIAAHVQARPHPVVTIRRGRARAGGCDRQPAQAREGIADDFALERDLALVADVGVRAAAARRIGVRGSGGQATR